MNISKLKKTAEDIYKKLKDSQIDVILDDRNVSAGVKFKDADLIGFPLQIILGEKSLKKNLVELKLRKTKKVKKVNLKSLPKNVSSLISA